MYVDFSGPLDWSDEADDLIRFIATEHFRAVGQQFIGKFQATTSSSGLTEYLANRLAGDLTLNDVWRPSFGMAERATRQSDEISGDLTAILVEMALGFGTSDFGGGEWSMTLGRPATFAIGHYCVPVRSDVRFRSGSNTISLERRDEAPLVFRKCAGRLEVDGEHADIEAMPLLNDNAHQVLFVSSAYFAERDEQKLPFPVSDVGSSLEQAWGKAFALIEQSSRAYDCWVSRAIQSIIPISAPHGSMVSGSQGHRPGEVYMTDILEPTRLAEMLVHESSHQMFQIATFLGPVENGADTELYYSPVVGTHRPIGKILLAYHAFANVILFLQRCRENAAGDAAFLESNLRRMRQEVELLQQPLRSTSGLTALGASLWQPLAERLLHVD